MKKHLCEHCGAELNKNNIGAYMVIVKYFKVDLKRKKLVYIEKEDFVEDFYFFCDECGEKLPLYEEDVLEILQGG